MVGVGVADGVFYMGGHFSGYDGPVPGSNFTTPIATRDKLAAVDEATGQVLSPWNPSVNTNLGIEALGQAAPQSPSAASSPKSPASPSSTSPCSTNNPAGRGRNGRRVTAA